MSCVIFGGFWSITSEREREREEGEPVYLKLNNLKRVCFRGHSLSLRHFAFKSYSTVPLFLWTTQIQQGGKRNPHSCVINIGKLSQMREKERKREPCRYFPGFARGVPIATKTKENIKFYLPIRTGRHFACVYVALVLYIYTENSISSAIIKLWKLTRRYVHIYWRNICLFYFETTFFPETNSFILIFHK